MDEKDANQKAIEGIEWHVSFEFPGWVCAEDQSLFDARQYAQKVVDDHNRLLVREERDTDDDGDDFG